MRIKELIKLLIPEFLYHKIRLTKSYLLRKKYLKEWQKRGRPVPPPHVVKQLAVKEYKDRHNITTLVETGTYLGDMVYAQLNDFRKIISIELDEKLFNLARKTFRKNENVEIIQGDSGEVLKDLVPTLKERTLFWLDGHYSGTITAKGEENSPVREELNTILESNLDHTILIDDAREFNGKNGYPTLKEIKGIIKSKNAQYNLETKDDIIRIFI